MDKLSKFSILAPFISSQNLFFLSTLKTENNSAAFGRHTSYHSSLQSKYIHFSRHKEISLEKCLHIKVIVRIENFRYIAWKIFSYIWRMVRKNFDV